MHHVFIFCIEGQEGDIYLGQNRGFPPFTDRGQHPTIHISSETTGWISAKFIFISTIHNVVVHHVFIFCIEGLKGDIYLGQNRGFPHFTDRGQHPTIHISSETTGWISAKFIFISTYNTQCSCASSVYFLH